MLTLASIRNVIELPAICCSYKSYEIIEDWLLADLSHQACDPVRQCSQPNDNPFPNWLTSYHALIWTSAKTALVVSYRGTNNRWNSQGTSWNYHELSLLWDSLYLRADLLCLSHHSVPACTTRSALQCQHVPLAIP